MQINDVRNVLAKNPTKVYKKRNLKAIKYLVIHHSGTKSGNARSFSKYHVNARNWPGIGYHYVILKDGTIEWANNLETITYHCRSYNPYSVGICLVGDFTKEKLAGRQLASLNELLLFLFAKLNLSIESVKGHREVNLGSTRCPGFDMERYRNSLNKEEIEVFINEKLINAKTLLKEGRTFVELRPLAEMLGYEVYWNDLEKNVYLKNKE